MIGILLGLLRHPKRSVMSCPKARIDTVESVNIVICRGKSSCIQQEKKSLIYFVTVTSKDIDFSEDESLKTKDAKPFSASPSLESPLLKNPLLTEGMDWNASTMRWLIIARMDIFTIMIRGRDERASEGEKSMIKVQNEEGKSDQSQEESVWCQKSRKKILSPSNAMSNDEERESISVVTVVTEWMKE